MPLSYALSITGVRLAAELGATMSRSTRSSMKWFICSIWRSSLSSAERNSSSTALSTYPPVTSSAFCLWRHISSLHCDTPMRHFLFPSVHEAHSAAMMSVRHSLDNNLIIVLAFIVFLILRAKLIKKSVIQRLLRHFSLKKFGRTEKKQYLCTAFRRNLWQEVTRCLRMLRWNDNNKLIIQF